MEAFVKENGFDSVEDFHRLVAGADLSTPAKLRAFEDWKLNDGSKKGLLNLAPPAEQADDETAEVQKQLSANLDALAYFRENIDYPFELIDFSDFTHWDHVGFVQVVRSNYKNGFFPKGRFFEEVGNDEIHYMKQDDDGPYHNLVYQRVGSSEDDYYGFALFPMKDGLYWKISYSC